MKETVDGWNEIEDKEKENVVVVVVDKACESAGIYMKGGGEAVQEAILGSYPLAMETDGDWTIYHICTI